jgi:hypothetical protein
VSFGCTRLITCHLRCESSVLVQKLGFANNDNSLGLAWSYCPFGVCSVHWLGEDSCFPRRYREVSLSKLSAERDRARALPTLAF